MIDLLRALVVLAEPPGPEQHRIAELLDLPSPNAAEHTEAFTLELHPYASVYLGPEGMVGGVARERTADFLRVLGMAPPSEPDQLGVLLAAYASVLEREATTECDDERHAWRRAREALLCEHLISWLPIYLARFDGSVGGRLDAWARLLDAALAAETDRSATARDLLPAHLADAPSLPDPREGHARGFVDGLLAPARSGFVLLDADLRDAAAQLGLGRRIGERRFVLRTLLDQDAPAVLGWLREHASRWARALQDHWVADIATGRWWLERSAQTASLLSELHAEATLVA